MTNLNAVTDKALHYLPIPICWFDKNLNFLGTNKKFLQLFLLSENQIIGEHISKYFDSYNFMSFMGNFVKDTELSAEYQHSILIERKLVHFKFSLQQITNPDRIILLSAEDITPLIEKNQEIFSLKEKALQSSRMAILGEMTSGIAHEINSPVAVIISHADQIKLRLKRKEHLTDENLDTLRRIERIIKTSYRIEKIVRSIKMISRDGAHDPFQNTLISDLINESIELCSEKLKNNKINLIIDEIEPGLFLDCRPAQISQILLNLIGNSNDAIAQSDEKWIRIQVKDAGDCVRFSLIDSGKGIPAEIATSITESFFTTKEVGSGTGLGLSISKKIVDSHFGQLYIDKDCPNTKFIFDIPKGLSAVI